MKHTAIYALYPSVVAIYGDIAKDAEGNEIEYDLDAVEVKVVELQAEEEAKIQAAETAKKAAQDKLAKLGLTPDDLRALLG